MYRFIPPLVVLTPRDSNVAVFRLFCVLYMPLFDTPWFRSSNRKVASKIAGSSFPISHLAFFFYLASLIFISHLAFLSRFSHFYLASRIFIAHLAFFFSCISHFLCRTYLQKCFSSPAKSHLECPLQAFVDIPY